MLGNDSGGPTASDITGIQAESNITGEPTWDVGTGNITFTPSASGLAEFKYFLTGGSRGVVAINNIGGGATTGADTLTGDATANTIDGLAGNDNLTGGGGDDTLIGGDGNDILLGGAGTDILVGGTFADNIAASAGSDIFEFTVQSDSPYVSDTNDWDLIKGFDANDQIDVVDIVRIGIEDDIFDKGDTLSPTPVSGTNFFDFGGLGPAMIAVGSTGNTGLLYVDVNGDGHLSGADLAVLFEGATDADDFDALADFAT